MTKPQADQLLLDQLLLGGGRKGSRTNGLADLRRVLSALDNPHKGLPGVVHVAGTNGKGSTVAIIKALAQAHGLVAHTHTSPHMARVTERICPMGTEIAPDVAMRHLGQVMAAEISLGLQLGFSQRLFAIACLAFTECPEGDLTLIETGLGGRLDPTNLLSGKAAAIVTAIGHDHMHILGETITEIAAEKAGIFRPGIPAIIARQPHPEALQVLVDMADHCGAEAIRAEAERLADGTWSLPGLDVAESPLPPPALAGAHQIDNAATALRAFAEVAPCALDRNAVEKALARVFWAGRLHPLASGPLVDLLPAGSQLWVDGAHNRDAMEPVAASLTALARGRKIQVIMTAGQRKEVGPMCDCLAEVTDRLIAIDYQHFKPMMPASELANIAKSCGLRQVNIAAGPAEAIALLDSTPSLVLVTGSLYLVGDLIASHVPAAPDPAL